MSETTDELEDRILTALKDGTMTRAQAVQEFVAAGWTAGLAIDFMSSVLDGKGE